MQLNLIQVRALQCSQLKVCRAHVQGTTIEITLWRGLAEKFYDHLEEGRVYIFRRGSVKLANKNYKTVRNDYTIHMDSGCAHGLISIRLVTP
jgi:hypothetical protein